MRCIELTAAVIAYIFFALYMSSIGLISEAQVYAALLVSALLAVLGYAGFMRSDLDAADKMFLSFLFLALYLFALSGELIRALVKAKLAVFDSNSVFILFSFFIIYFLVWLSAKCSEQHDYCRR